MLSPDRIVETDGLGAPLMRRVCGWCRADLGMVVCRPDQVGDTSHGMCPACSAKLTASLEVEPPAPAPATSTSAPERPLFWTVQGADFGRSNAWAKRQPNLLTQAIRRRLLP